MKKLLYGTTALAAAGLIAGQATAAEQIKMGVGGYFQAFIFGGSVDDGAGNGGRPDVRSHGISREGEIIFNGKTTLDNGIQFGVQVQLEAEVCGDQIDESFMWVSGNFGRINIGSENSAAYLMHYAAPAPSHWAHGLNSPNHSHTTFGVTTFLATNPVGLSSDAEKVTYFTPRLAGFQLGASYTPDLCEEATTIAGAATGTSVGAVCGGSYAGLPSENTAGQQSEVVEIGVNYVNKFGGVDVALSGSWGEANAESAAGAATPVEDREEWSLGAQFGFAGFTLGGAYRDDNLGSAIGSTSNSDQINYNLGLRYATGPWGVGIQYAHTEIGDGHATAGATGENEVDAFELGGSYALGPGIVLNGGVQFWDHQDDDNAAGVENDATIFFVGTHIAF